MKRSFSSTPLPALHESLLGSIKNQVYHIWPVIIINSGMALAAIVGSFFLSRHLGIPPEYLTRDPAEVAKLGTYVGLLSNLGIILWAATTGICFWAAVLLKTNNLDRRLIMFLFTSGLFSLALTIDDTFQFHESMFPRHFHISAFIVYAAYVIIMVSWLLYFRRYILITDYINLILALGFLGVSLVFELLFKQAFIEDSLKFIGIAFWLTYFSGTAIIVVRNGFGGTLSD